MTLENIYKESKSWVFKEAYRLLEHVKSKKSRKDYVLFETGYGPSGLPHIGTFGEVVRTVMVKNAFEKLSGMKTKLICFSDDMDGMRKIPTNLPNQEMLLKYIDLPLSEVPDPFGERNSFGEYMNQKMKSFLDNFGFEYEFYSATKCYKDGMFDDALLNVLKNYQAVMDIMLPTLREERRATYSPFMPICKETGKVLQVKIENYNVDEGTISYKSSNGELVTSYVTKGRCKLQWKPDFAMRWAALDVDYEMYGKDHRPNAEIYSKLCKLLGQKPPVQFFYEMFLGEDGSKISKSKGNGISLDHWLKYAPVESLSLFMYGNPERAKRLYFDIIPKCVDEYIAKNLQYHNETDQIKKLDSPLYHIHNGRVPDISVYGINFSLLLNLVSVCNPDDSSILFSYIKKYEPKADISNESFLNKLVNHATIYYEDYIKNRKVYLKPDVNQKKLLKIIIDELNKIDDKYSNEEIQSIIYKIGMDNSGLELKQYFKLLYQILFGQDAGPRLGSFIKLYGIKETIELIKDRTK